MTITIVAEEDNHSTFVPLEAPSSCMLQNYTSTDFFLILVCLYRVPDAKAYLSISIW